MSLLSIIPLSRFFECNLTDREFNSSFLRFLLSIRLVFSFQFASITAILGGNGTGKTTTLSMLLDPGAHFGFDQSIRSRLHKRPLQRLGRMNFSSPYVDLPQRLTVRENLTVYAKLYGVENVKGRIMQVSEEFRLGNLLDRRVRKLSSGQKTRVSGKSMINRPEFLLLDEPTA